MARGHSDEDTHRADRTMIVHSGCRLVFGVARSHCRCTTKRSKSSTRTTFASQHLLTNILVSWLHSQSPHANFALRPPICDIPHLSSLWRSGWSLEKGHSFVLSPRVWRVCPLRHSISLSLFTRFSLYHTSPAHRSPLPHCGPPIAASVCSADQGGRWLTSSRSFFFVAPSERLGTLTSIP